MTELVFESPVRREECAHVGYEKSRCLTCNEKSWLCATCGHRLYEHATKREPNSGKSLYAHCGVEGCACGCGQNRLYPLGVQF